MQTNVRGLPCYSFKFLWRTVHLKTTLNTFRDWRLYFFRNSWKDNPRLHRACIEFRLDANSDNLFSKHYKSWALNRCIRSNFSAKKKLHYWVPLYFGTDEYYFTICKICEYLSVQRCRINSTLISHGFFVVMQIKDSVMFMAVVTFSSTVKTVKWVEATV